MRSPASSTATCAPRAASARAADKPVKPAPTIATSTLACHSPACGDQVGTVSVQYDCNFIVFTFAELRLACPDQPRCSAKVDRHVAQESFSRREKGKLAEVRDQYQVAC